MKKISLVFATAIFIGFSITSTSCKNDKIVEAPTCDTTTSITYNLQIKQIFDSKCVSCHSDGGTSPNLTTYNNVQNNFTNCMSEINSGSMPQGGNKLDAATITMLNSWKCQGFKN